VATRAQRRILIVDDVEDNRDMYALYLEHVGFQVEVAPDGEVGLQMAQNEPFDVIVMDLSMSSSRRRFGNSYGHGARVLDDPAGA